MTRVIQRGIKKAKASPCRYKICAVGVCADLGLVFKTNTPRFPRKGGGNHAEMRLMKQYGSKLRAIILLRVNRGGELLPIDPCEVCSAKAKELGITITPVRVL